MATALPASYGSGNKLTIYMVEFGSFAAISAEFLAQVAPVCAPLGVADLPRGPLVEIDAIVAP
jgi:hypothetical protein